MATHNQPSQHTEKSVIEKLLENRNSIINEQQEIMHLNDELQRMLDESYQAGYEIGWGKCEGTTIQQLTKLNIEITQLKRDILNSIKKTFTGSNK